MANDRLRSAIFKAGLEIEDLAARIEVDAKTVQRWLGGRTPHARYRAKVANVLQVEESDLWPETIPTVQARDDRREISGAFAHSNDVNAPDWRTLMQAAGEQIDLLDYSLKDILAAPGVTDLLASKAAAGCQVRILIAHPKSVWVTSISQQLGQDHQDAEGNTELDREINLAHGYLQPLIELPGIELGTFWAERYNTILRFDDQMLVTLHLWATPGPEAPLIHLQRRGEHGLFDQFVEQLDAICDQASEPIQANPDLYPPPTQNPQRYQPITREQAEKRRHDSRQRSEREIAASRPLEEVREEIRRGRTG